MNAEFNPRSLEIGLCGSLLRKRDPGPGSLCQGFQRSSVSRTWEPLVPVVNGTLDRKYGSAVLRGTYQERPILATQILGGAENPDTFRIEMTTISCGANWLVRYGSEKLFGKDQWYLQAGHEN